MHFYYLEDVEKKYPIKSIDLVYDYKKCYPILSKELHGFALGLAIATYEWMAAVTLLVVGKFFLPIYIEKNIYTIPEFVKKRYSNNLNTILASPC